MSQVQVYSRTIFLRSSVSDGHPVKPSANTSDSDSKASAPGIPVKNKFLLIGTSSGLVARGPSVYVVLIYEKATDQH
jgi:hypothetical protein